MEGTAAMKYVCFHVGALIVCCNVTLRFVEDALVLRSFIVKARRIAVKRVYTTYLWPNN